MLASFGNLSAAQMAELWAGRAILGQEYTEPGSRGIDVNGAFSEPKTETAIVEAVLPPFLQTMCPGIFYFTAQKMCEAGSIYSL